jgi:hypothetical protein
MKAFWIYTLARFGVLAATYLVIWGLASIWADPAFANLFVLLVSFVVSSLISFFVLRSLRDDLATHLGERAGRITQRIEESRRAEDVD